jgi:hypothetical protein
VGVKFKSDYEAIKRGLKLKKDVKKDLGILGEDEEGDVPEDKDELFDHFSDGKAYILP